MNRHGVMRRDKVGDSATAAPDHGFSLIEVVMTIVLMATVTIAIMEASLGGIRASSAATDLAQIETVLQNAADRVNRAPLKCDYAVYIQAAAQSAGWPAQQATATYRWYQPGVDATQAHPGSWHDGPCSTPGVAGKDVQLVTITIVSPNGKVSRSMQVVKSNV